MHGRGAVALALALAWTVSAATPAPAVVPTRPNGPLAAERPAALVAIDAGSATELPGSSAADDDPELSPLSNAVAFETGNQIWVADWPSGANRRQLTSAGTNLNPAFAPDGLSLAFRCNAGLCTVPVTGGAARHVGGSLVGDSDPDFDPTGQFVVADAGAGIVRIGLADGVRTVLTDTAPGDDHPRVAPDGSVVYFDTGVGIAKLAWPGGGARAALTGSTGGDDDPTPAPDGTLVAFDTAAGIRTLPAGGGAKTPLPGSAVGDNSPAWGPALDTQAPTTSATLRPAPNAAGWNRGDVIVSLSAVDPVGGLGVTRIDFDRAGAETGAGTIAGASGDVLVQTSGTTTLGFSATDGAGNVETRRSTSVSIDREPPQTTVRVSPDGTVAVAAVDSLSGVARIDVVRGGPSAERTAFTGAAGVLSLTRPGPTSLLVYATDVAGNVEAPLLDSANPSAPVNRVRPRVLGTARFGRRLRCTRGTWTSALPVSFAVRWLRDGRLIDRAAGTRYRLRAHDAGRRVGCRVVARNRFGARTAASRARRVVAIRRR